ncbi:MAG TPA: FmdB family zinc ribbon protein [Spirochaetia bacterium]|nr:FmdB family zinc ribbon protein [Spirochaetia bacterium]
MPMFEYKCRDCGSVNEFLVGVTASDPEILCETCGGKKLDRMISTISINVGQSRSKFPIAGQCQCGNEAGQGSCAGGGCACMS